MCSPRSTLLILAATLVGITACASHYARQADEDATELIASVNQRLDRKRRNTLVKPDDAGPMTGPVTRLPTPVVPEVLRLPDALRIATERNREYLTQREGLLLTALSVLGTRDAFQPRFSSNLAYSLSDGTGTRRVQSGTFSLGVSQVFPTGGDVTVSGQTTLRRDENDADPHGEFSSSAGVTLTQPLLRGFGRESRYESLTQAEKDLVYAVRSFELFRQDFTIRISRRFVDLVVQKTIIENNEQNLKQSEFGRDRSTRFFELGRGSELDKFRAEQEYRRAESRTVQSRESFQVAMDRFKIDLGLPPEVEFDIAFEPPGFEPVDIDLGAAVNAALANRLDLETSRDRVEDFERRMRIARRNLLPDLDLTASYDATFPADRSFHDQGTAETGYDVGLRLELPLERVSERNAYRRALITLAREQRGRALDEENVILEVRVALRRLTTLETTLRIEEQSLVGEQRRFEIAKIRRREGRLGNRDVVEAQNSLLDVKNRIVEIRMDYAIERLSLLRTIGTLFLDENGVPVR